MNNKTLAIIKPDAVGDNHIGEIISMINKAGFKIKALKMIKLSKDAAKAFYEIHKDRPFYDELVEYMTSVLVFLSHLKKKMQLKIIENLSVLLIQLKLQKEQ